MNAELATLDRWRADGRRYALAIVVETWGSSPRPVGAVMGIREDGLIVGSVSAGCVEGAVIEAALRCIARGETEDLRFERVSDAVALAVGLSCGGTIRVIVRPDTALSLPLAGSSSEPSAIGNRPSSSPT